MFFESFLVNKQTKNVYIKKKNLKDNFLKIEYVNIQLTQNKHILSNR